VAFLIGGVAAGVLFAYLLANPTTFGSMHPLPLLALLAITAVIALWQASALLR
jgi:hypothetical protein